MVATKLDKTNPQGIREDEIEIEGEKWDAPEIRVLWAREMLQFDLCRTYWQHYIERGRRLQDFYDGKIFTDDQRAILEDVEGKITVEPRIMKAPIRAFVGQIIKSRRSGQIETEGGFLDQPNETANEILVVDAVLKAMEQRTGEKYLIRDAIHDSCVACYPVTTLFEKGGPSDALCCGGYKLSHLPWDSVVYGPLTFKRTSQIEEWHRLEFRTKAELIENFSDMEDQIKEHFQMGKTLDTELLSSISKWEGDISSELRDKLYDIVQVGVTQMLEPTGFVPVIEHIFPIKRTEDVWENMEDESGSDYKVKPETWSKKRWQEWLDTYGKQYKGPYERPVRTLWSTVFTLTGLVLENKKHWFQEHGRLPASIWVPAMTFGVPTGPGEDMEDDALATAVAETEYLHDIRTGTGKLLVIKEGSVKNAGDLTSEASKSLGVVIVDKAVMDVRTEIMEMTRTPNKQYKEYAEQRKSSMAETTRINETMQGAAAPRQAAIAKNLEIAQALIVNALYIDSFNEQWEAHQNLKLALIPYAFQGYDVLQIIDETTNEPQVVEVNAPAETSMDAEGNVAVDKVINDITSRSYRWKIKPVDDSPTAKDAAMQEALVFINAASGPLINADPTGRFFALVLAAMPNIFLNQAGKALEKDAEVKAESQGKAEQQQVLQKAQVELLKAQADMERAKKTGASATFSGADLAQYPALLQILNQLWGGQQAPPMQPAPQPPAAPMQPPAGPPQQPVGEPQPVQVGGPV